MHKTPQRYWTVNEVNAVKQLWGTVPVKDIAKQLNRSCSSLYGFAARNGLPSSYVRHRPPLDLEELTELLEFGYSVTQIADIMKCSTDTVYNYVKKLTDSKMRILRANGRARKREGGRYAVSKINQPKKPVWSV